jgi:hypothetical protein
MQKIILTASLIYFGLSASAQTNFKLYLNNGQTNASLISTFSIAINKPMPKNRYIEYEIGAFRNSNINNFYHDSVGTKTITSNHKEISFRARYERGQTILQSKFKKKDWKLMLGHSAQLHIGSFKTTPYLTNTFPIAQEDFHIKYAIIPRINIDLSKKLVFDLNFPVSLLRIGRLANTIDNPAIPVQERQWSVLDLDVFGDHIGLRLGIAYKFARN